MIAFHEINEIIASLVDLSGVGVCFYDLENFFKYNSDGKREHIGHYCELCKNVRLLDGGRELCERSDRMEALQLAKAYREPFFFKCHIGMCELIVPIFAEDRLRGIIFLGQCRMEGETHPEEVGAAAAKLGGSAEVFAELYRALPAISRENLLSMGKIVQLYFKNLTGENIFTGASDETIGLPLAERIAYFIRKNYMKDISPHVISERFFVNQSYMARIFRQSFGCTVTDYINCIRCENAARLLTGTSLPIHSIALNVGYSDANYFARCFAKLYGISPAGFRK
jgi:AraC-like DNA-binding protein